jgi:hypothetical protein
MGNWDYSAVHGINKYLWAKLKEELGWSEANYGGLTPITTPQQQPEFNAYNFPYIVYGYSPQATGPDWLLEGEVIAYTVFSASSADIRKAVNVMKWAFNRFDESAVDVNKYIQANGSADNKAFDYKAIRLTSASGPEPSLTEGGRQDGSVVISVMFTHDSRYQDIK